MIKYRYHITDPEPPASVIRIGADDWRHYGQYRGGMKHWDWSDRWERVPCAGRGHGTVMKSGDPDWYIEQQGADRAFHQMGEP